MRKTLIVAAVLTATACGGYAYDTNHQGRLVVQAGNTVPTCAVAANKGDVCIGGDLQINDDVQVDSDLSVLGELDVTGNLLVTGSVQGALRKVIAGGAAYTVAQADCGAVVLTATDNAVITLPEATVANLGCAITVINTGADGAALVSISPNAADAVFGSCVGITGAGAATVIASGGVNDKDFNNTKATANKGDTATLTSDGSTGWYLSGCIGEWASTP